MTKEHISWKEELMYAKWCTMSNLAVPISRLYDFMDWILCSDDCWLVQTWQMLCGLKTILTDMNILNSYRHIRPKKVKYPIPKIPDDSGKKSGTDWVLPKIIGSGRVWVWVRVLVSYIESIGYYRVLKFLIGYFPILSYLTLWVLG